jgi:putative two-component system response regulator
MALDAATAVIAILAGSAPLHLIRVLSPLGCVIRPVTGLPHDLATDRGPLPACDLVLFEAGAQ